MLVVEYQTWRRNEPHVVNSSLCVENTIQHKSERDTIPVMCHHAHLNVKLQTSKLLVGRRWQFSSLIALAEMVAMDMLRSPTRHLFRVIVAFIAAVLLVPFMVIKRQILTSSPWLENGGPMGNQYLNISQISLRRLQGLLGLPTSVKAGVQIDNMPQLPRSLSDALSRQTTVGYLIGNRSALSFRPYPKEVDLRIVVLAYNRAESLRKCLMSLNTVDYEGSKVSLHVWIDRHNETNTLHAPTLKVATTFTFLYGTYSYHIQPNHVGIQGQWLNTWRPSKNCTEIALILEDDMTVSRYFWRWLRAAHVAYGNRADVSGYGLAHPGMEHVHATFLDIPAMYNVYLYRVICTWGFAPRAESWRQFQNWFYEKEQNASFHPLVEGILPTHWYLGELRQGKQRNLWEMWHICYTHNSQPWQYTVLLNTVQEGLLAVNRHETGLHDPGGSVTEPLCERWKNAYSHFPQDPPKFGYDGVLEGGGSQGSNLTQDEEGEDDEYWIMS